MAQNTTPTQTPYDRMGQAPAFTVTSGDVTHGQPFPAKHTSGAMGMPGGQDTSPHLTWSGFPQGTKSFAVTVFDPDAPTPSGFWHWAVVNIPGSVTELAQGVGAPSGPGLPASTFQLRNDASQVGYIGAAPPAGHGTHHYYIAVHALDTDSLDVKPDATPAYLCFIMRDHTLARAVMVSTAER